MQQLSTDNVVALGQNKATKNITKMPGVKNPVKFWIYWNADSKLPKRGVAENTAITKATTEVDLPILTNFVFDGSDVA